METFVNEGKETAAYVTARRVEIVQFTLLQRLPSGLTYVGRAKKFMVETNEILTRKMALKAPRM